MTWNKRISKITRGLLYFEHLLEEIIHAGCTSLAQPLVVSINKLFKDNLRAAWCKQLRGMKMEIFANQHAKTSSKPHQNLMHQLDQKSSVGKHQWTGYYNYFLVLWYIEQAWRTEDDLCSFWQISFTRRRRTKWRTTLLFDSDSDSELDFDGFDGDEF